MFLVLLIFALHIDKCTINSSLKELIKEFKAKIGLCFKITDLGPICWLLGMKASCDQEAQTIYIS
ncbi:hypothetical protein PAXRUDRAFT_162149 [Paxillus rubicundulus Ve08.2h10]|uniref:Reverse transcriptase Ty1/copia-type domain-containing protein n=1 Tax=Paxillus rubicundulus Ve08.2h10 TaxID=930991 RepID=A0A0D0CUJ3_9AGAM|nr:hypothetical protein PAXRUDRAFT_162149 [Paxillus rubicundulus Ve08.2h10]